MITMFNRKEFCITYDIAEQSRIRKILSNNGIEYLVYTKNLLSPTVCETRNQSTLGLDLNRTIEYKIYVKKEDYDKAQYVLYRSQSKERKCQMV